MDKKELFDKCYTLLEGVDPEVAKEFMQSGWKDDLPRLLSFDVGDIPKEKIDDYLKRVKERFEQASVIVDYTEPKIENVVYIPKYPDMYQMIADENELHWFFDHVIMRPQVNESYSAVFVSRHKKLTKEEQEEFGLTRKEAEFLATQTFKMRNIKDGSSKDDPTLWTFEQFLSRIKRFNVDKGAYTTSTGQPIPTKTLAVIFYVNPGDDMKVCKKFVEEYNDVNEAISKTMLNGKTTAENYQSYQWFGNAESNIKHLKANQKGSKYWMDFDIDVPKWFKDAHLEEVGVRDYAHNKEWQGKSGYESYMRFYLKLKEELNNTFGKGNYVVVDTSGGYHVLVRTSAIKSNPHDFCKKVENIYKEGLKLGFSEYLDEKGNCKFECIINDSQIPGLPLPGTYQYGRPVTVLNKEDFE